MKRNESFDKVAKVYDEIRPSYPQELINDIIDKTEISCEDKLLEIGAGTGKATIQLAEKGLQIHCVELGQNLADILIKKCLNYPKVTVDVASFEQWQPKPKETFDLVYCAQAFHWIDPQIRYKKCHSLLNENGHIALFWYGPSNEISKVNLEINSLIEKYVPNYSNNDVEKNNYMETREMRKAEIVSSGLFTDVQIFEYLWENALNTDMYIKVLNSYSGYAVLKDELKIKLNKEVENIVNKHGGIVKSKLMFNLFIAKKD